MYRRREATSVQTELNGNDKVKLATADRTIKTYK